MFILYIYKSSIGLIAIKFDKNVNKLALWINDDCYGFYTSKAAAADDVAQFETGCYDWDCLYGTATYPRDIREWEKI